MKHTKLTAQGTSQEQPWPLLSSIFEADEASGEICQIAIPVAPLTKNTSVTEIFDIFMSNQEIFTLPVVNDDLKPIGALHRFEFFERIILGRYGYGISLNSRKQAYEVMRRDIIVLDGDLSLEEAGAIVSSRYSQDYQLDLIISCKEVYRGILPIKVLLYYLSEKTLRLAKETNPLTGLPGNWSIRREVERRLKNKEDFEVIYIDLNDFKPYNDCYGFDAGDEVIKSLGEILTRLAPKFSHAWVGHIGGDDFVVMVKSNSGETFCSELCQEFERQRHRFHREEDLQKNYFESLNRQGERRIFNLLTLSCAIIPSNCFSSFGELSSKATELKNYVKRISKENGKSYFMRDRRALQAPIIHKGK